MSLGNGETSGASRDVKQHFSQQLMKSKQKETNMQQSRLKRLGLAAGLLVLTGGAQAALVDAGNGLVNDTVLVSPGWRMRA